MPYMLYCIFKIVLLRIATYYIVHITPKYSKAKTACIKGLNKHWKTREIRNRNNSKGCYC